MAYLTYSDYTTMGGTLPEATFNRFEFGAEKHIDRLTHGRVISEAPVRAAIKNLTFEIVQYLSSVTDGNAAYTSASNEGVSVAYASQAEQRTRVREMAMDYLDQEETTGGIPLMYAGVDT